MSKLDGITIISSIPCFISQMEDVWDENFDETQLRTLTIKQHLDVPEGCDDDSVRKYIDTTLNLDIFAMNMNETELSDLISMIFLNYDDKNDLKEGFNLTIKNMDFTPNLLNILEQLDGDQWCSLMFEGVKYHRCGPKFNISPYDKLWDTFGIFDFESYLHVGLYLRSSSLRKERYLALADSKNVEILKYAKPKITFNDILEYCKIYFNLETKSIIYHPSLLGIINDDLKMREFISESIIASLTQGHHRLLLNFKFNQPASRLIKFCIQYPKEAELLGNIFCAFGCCCRSSDFGALFCKL